MTPYEMMLSESQERMLIILEDRKENEAEKYLKNGILTCCNGKLLKSKIYL